MIWIIVILILIIALLTLVYYKPEQKAVAPVQQPATAQLVIEQPAEIQQPSVPSNCPPNFFLDPTEEEDELIVGF